MLAKEVATLDVLSGSRMEFGLGAGWKRVDYTQADLDYDPPGTRIDRMVESLEIAAMRLTTPSRILVSTNP